MVFILIFLCREKAEKIEPTIQATENSLPRSGVTHKNLKKLTGSQKKDQNINKLHKKKRKRKESVFPKVLEKLSAERVSYLTESFNKLSCLKII